MRDCSSVSTPSATTLSFSECASDGHGRQTHVPPPHIIGYGLAQNPLPNTIYQPGFLEERNELTGRHQTRSRVIPAQQRLGASKSTGFQLKLRLTVNHELHILERLSKLTLQYELP